ncbi:serine hydrolase [Mitsuaria sp. GD03876]|uniref:serine hydrolase domain-containing protein n=1 Tax=Mitsuaria sp. GD03876 TaxID=2975399 RepID=UPI00244B674F|nr:serine hydrolase [Mitsuaria sp. GD03876]MDH0868284.1 beta-lactamase family protein [Mitsuaria sp. GD03876]
MTEQATAEAVAERPLGAAALDELLQGFNRGDAPGCVVGVAHRGQVLYRRAFGLASVELGIANQVHTRLRIGSTSKQFTCLAVLLLAEDGRLDIDAPIGTFFPEFTGPQGAPTLRQLMHHTGGLRCFLDLGLLTDGGRVRPAGAALASQRRQAEVNFLPGDNIAYNNGGYHLLSRVVEMVGGMPFEDFLRERILLPLGMRDTASVRSDLSIVPGLAALHVPVPEGGYRRGLFPSQEVLGEGGLVSTVDDLLRWMAHLREPTRVGNARTWRQMLTPARLNNGTTTPYAAGLMVHTYRGVDIVQHGGSVVGGSCLMATLPGQALDIVAIANGAALTPKIFNGLIEAVLGDDVLGPPTRHAMADDHRPMVGAVYHAPESGLVVSFADVEGKLVLTPYHLGGAPLVDDGERLGVGFESMALGGFEVDKRSMATEGEAPERLFMTEAGTLRALRRVPPRAPTVADAAAGLLGRYRAPDLDAQARIVRDGDALRLEIDGPWGGHALALEPLTADLFKATFPTPMAITYGASLEVERDGTRAVTLRLSSWRSRRVRFDRVPD